MQIVRGGTGVATNHTRGVGLAGGADLRSQPHEGPRTPARVEMPDPRSRIVLVEEPPAGGVTHSADAAQTISLTQTTAAVVVDEAQAAQTITVTQTAAALIPVVITAAQTVTVIQSTTGQVTDLAQAAQTVTASQAATAQIVAVHAAQAAQVITALQAAEAEVREPVFLFRTPLVSRPMVSADANPAERALLRHFTGHRTGVAVLIVGGQVVQRRVPDTNEMAAASHIFLGGHDNIVTDRQIADLLTQAGYTLIEVPA